MKNALLIFNMQYDFLDGGAMAHSDSLELIPLINRIKDNFDLVVFIKENHPFNHCTFKQYGGSKPTHAVQSKKGSELHCELLVESKDIIITIGELQKYDSTSGFYNAEPIQKETNLRNILKINKITNLYFCGNGMDSIIFSTILDAINFRFKCYVIKNAVTYMKKQNYDRCIEFLKKNNIIFINIDENTVLK